MRPTAVHAAAQTPAGFRHEALFYSGQDGFLAATVPFLLDGLDAGEPAMVVVSEPRIGLLRSALGAAADDVLFADMATVGHNPARIIPAWQQFLDEQAPHGRPVRGIGEPIWAARTPAELVECQRHEALLNVAFGQGAPWQLVCPYDVAALGADVLEEAARSHPFTRRAVDGPMPSPRFDAEQMRHAHASAPLPEPASCLEVLTFGPDQLSVVRGRTAARADQFGVDAHRVADLVLAVHEIAANSIRHGGGAGRFRLWRAGRSLVAEISDAGTIDDPLAGRRQPGEGPESGRGLWIANQLCDLLAIRSVPGGSVIRLHLALDG